MKTAQQILDEILNNGKFGRKVWIKNDIVKAMETYGRQEYERGLSDGKSGKVKYVNGVLEL